MVKRQVAQELGIHENLLRSWIRQFAQGKWEVNPGTVLKSAQQLENERLKCELKRVTTERDIFKKGGGLLRQATLVKYGFVAQHQSIWPVRTMCRVLVVPRAGFYEWHSRSPSRRSLEDPRLMPLVRTSFAQNDGTYGAVRVARDLREWGEGCGKRRVGRADALGVASGAPEATPTPARPRPAARAQYCAERLEPAL